MWPGVIQYVANLITGCFLFLVMAAYMSVAAGVSAFGLVLVLTPLMIGGFYSGIALFAPKLSAVASILFVSPFLYSGIVQIIDPSAATDSATFVIPSALVLAVSGSSLLWSTTSAWSVQTSWVEKMVVAFLPRRQRFFQFTY